MVPLASKCPINNTNCGPEISEIRMESQIVPGYSREEISNLQQEDPDLKLLFAWLER